MAVVPSEHQPLTRDFAVLRDLWLHRYLTSLQISRLHFGHLKLAQRRLRKLTEQGLLTRFRIPRSKGFGDQRWFYCLSRHGARLLSEAHGIRERILLPAHLPTTGGFLTHHEILCDFRIWLREACQSSPRLSCRFVPAWEEVSEAGSRRRRVAVQLPASGEQYIPDGVFSVERGEASAALFILEVDRSTEPLERANGSSIAAKLRNYRWVFDDGFPTYADLFDREFGGARMLWVVPDARRAAAILGLACQEDLASVVWATEASTLRSRGSFLAACWSVAGRDGFLSLGD